MKGMLTKVDLIEKFNQQLNKLETFNKLFDEGDKGIAAELAVKIRVLFHNTNTSKSLLKQLKLTHISFVDTSSSYNSRNLLTHLGLLLTRVHLTEDQASSEILIKGDSAGKRDVDFDNWWDNRVVISDKFHRKFTRRKIVLELADTDGGAHVDSKLKEDYW